MGSTLKSPTEKKHSNPQPYADTGELLHGCVNGDVAARTEFIVRFKPLIARIVASKFSEMCSPQHPVRGDVEDVQSDILERLLRDDCALLSKLRDMEKINAWLIILSRNHAVDYVRKHGSRMRALELKVEHESIAEPLSLGDILIEKERAEILARQLAALPVLERLMMEMQYNQALKHAEIAEITSQNVDTVSTQLRRIKIKLRTLLEPMRQEL